MLNKRGTSANEPSLDNKEPNQPTQGSDLVPVVWRDSKVGLMLHLTCDMVPPNKDHLWKYNYIAIGRKCLGWKST